MHSIIHLSRSRHPPVLEHQHHVTLELHQVCLERLFEPMVRLTQTVHLSSVKISTMSERTETSFLLSLVILEYHQVRPK
jgi:hypothetical protein